jgi:hypothetical protein
LQEAAAKKGSNKMISPRIGLAVTALIFSAVTRAQGSTSATEESPRALARSIFQELIEINTTDSVGNVTSAAEAMAKRFRAAGFPQDDLASWGPTRAKRTWWCAITVRANIRSHARYRCC